MFLKREIAVAKNLEDSKVRAHARRILFQWNRFKHIIVAKILKSHGNDAKVLCDFKATSGGSFNVFHRGVLHAKKEDGNTKNQKKKKQP